MSREKLIKAPNIVHFTRRFNQTTFWCQKEILNCKRIETRGKMLTHFIKISKRLNELHSFNSLMAIVVALKSAPIYRLKKTWSQHVSKRDTTTFERLADLMFDTSDNKRKIRDMHMNCKLPCIPFLGLFLTDLIHIDIAHPHNSFDNPQRRNQMNNICRLISEYQQSNYQDLTSLSCSCCFTPIPNSISANSSNGLNGAEYELNSSSHSGKSNNSINNLNSTSNGVCLINNCNCAIHHGSGYGDGMINSDGTIYISEISYVKNYLNSFLYIEELQKFKEDENYRDSLELEPDPGSQTPSSIQTASVNQSSADDSFKLSLASDAAHPLHFSTSSPNKLYITSTGSNANGKSGQLTSYTSVTDSTAKNHSLLANQHRKTHSLANSLFINGIGQPNNANLLAETKEFINELKVRHHPLDDSIVESTNNLTGLGNYKKFLLRSIL